MICTVAFVFWSYESLNQTTVKALSSKLTVWDSTSKSYRDLGLSSVEDSRAGAGNREMFEADSALPLLHISPSVVSRVLFGGAGEGGKEPSLSPLSGVAGALEAEERWLQARKAL